MYLFKREYDSNEWQFVCTNQQAIGFSYRDSTGCEWSWKWIGE